MADGPFPLLSRRRLLKFSLGAGGLVAAGVGGLFALRGSAPEVTGLKVLNPQEYRTFASLAAAAFPEGEVPSSSLDLARAFDGYLSDEPEWHLSEAKAALLLLEFGPVLFERRLTTFSQLEPLERIAHFHRWGASDSEVRRQVFVGFKKFLSLVFYDQPEVWPSLAYEGPLIREATP
jgi:hypothetical protein